MNITIAAESKKNPERGSNLFKPIYQRKNLLMHTLY